MCITFDHVTLKGKVRVQRHSHRSRVGIGGGVTGSKMKNGGNEKYLKITESNTIVKEQSCEECAISGEIPITAQYLSF